MKAWRNFRYFQTAEAAAVVMAAESVELLQRQIDQFGSTSIALTGGSGPKHLYRVWAEDHRQSLDWNKVHWFWGDERNVDLEHRDSNCQTSKSLLEALPIDKAKVHPWRTDLAPSEALAEMRQVLAKALIHENKGEVSEQSLGLCLLGVGPDGHVASLFPDHKPWQQLESPQADEVAFVDNSPKPPPERFTFTLPFINRSRVIYILPFGESKRRALEGMETEDKSLPVVHVHAQEQTIIWTDLD